MSDTIQPPNMMVCINIANYVNANKTLVMDILDEETNLWGAALCEFFNGVPGNTIYALDRFDYPTREEAMADLRSVIEFSLNKVKIMSN